MRKRTFIVLLLLTAFGLGFAAGAHPCEAGQEERESRAPSCHEAPGSSGSPAVQGSVPAEDGDPGCCETVCPHVCHMSAAAAGMRPEAFAVEIVSQVVMKGSGRALSPLAHPIDHVPLA